MVKIKGLVERIEEGCVDLEKDTGNIYNGVKIKIRTRNDRVYANLPIVLDQNCIKFLIGKEVEYIRIRDMENKLVGPGIHYNLKCKGFDINKFILYAPKNQ